MVILVFVAVLLITAKKCTMHVRTGTRAARFCFLTELIQPVILLLAHVVVAVTVMVFWTHCHVLGHVSQSMVIANTELSSTKGILPRLIFHLAFVFFFLARNQIYLSSIQCQEVTHYTANEIYCSTRGTILPQIWGFDRKASIKTWDEPFIFIKVSVREREEPQKMTDKNSILMKNTLPSENVFFIISLQTSPSTKSSGPCG